MSTTATSGRESRTTARSALTLLVLASGALLAISELDRGETGGFSCLNEGDGVGSCFDDRAGNLLSLLVEDLGHAQLFSNDSDHFSTRP